MKAIQVTFDEDLLKELDESEEVRREGRSAVLRKAVADYLLRRRQERIERQYRKAYADSSALGKEFADWSEEGVWPED